MKKEDPLRKRYLRSLWIGIGILIVLAIPATVDSHAAIDTLFNHPAAWVPDSLPEKAEFNRFLEDFPVSDLLMVAWEDSDLGSPSLAAAANVLRPLCVDSGELDPTSDTLAEAANAIESERRTSIEEQIERVRLACRTSTPLLWVRTGTEMVDRLTSPPANLSPAAAVARLRGSLVGPDGRRTCLVISLGEAGQTHRRELIPGIRSIISTRLNIPPSQIAIVGSAFEGAVVDAESIRSIRVFTPPSAIIAALLCLMFLRSIPLTAAIVSVAVIGEGLVLAAVYYTGTPMNAVLIVLPPLVFVLTVSAGIHLSNYYMDASADFPDLSRAGAARRAMRAGVWPCCLAAGTTVLGLSSLLLVRLEPVRIFGGVAAIGVIFTLGLLFLVLPGAMVLTRPHRQPHRDVELRRDGLGAAIRRWMRRRLARPWPTILSFAIVAAGLSIGLTRLESSVNVPRMFRADSPIRRQFLWFEANVAPTVTGELLLTFSQRDDQDDPLERLAVVARVHRTMLDQAAVGGALSAVSFLPSVPRQRSLAATARRSVVRALIRDPDSSLGQLGFIARRDNREIWRISLRMSQHQQDDFGEKLAALHRAVLKELDDVDEPVEVTFTGGVVIVQKTQEILLRDLFRSFLAAFAVIAIVMMLMLRSILGGLIAMAPNLFPTVALFGALGLLRIPLDIGSVMSASVALGIAVDDTVHLLSRFGSRRARGFGQIRAAFGALEQCAGAMFQTTMVCGLSLMAYWFSDFVPTSRFSLFVFALLSSALLGVTLLLPTLMASRLGRWLSRTIGADAGANLYADSPDPPKDIRRLPTRFQREQARAEQP